jgi:hypothetical protein
LHFWRARAVLPVVSSCLIGPIVEKIAAVQRRLIATSMPDLPQMSSNRSNVAYLPNKNDTQQKFVLLPTQNGVLNSGFPA